MIKQGDRAQANYRRSETLPENTFKLFQGPYRLDYDLGQRIEKQGYSKTYNANSVTIYSNI